MSIKASGVSPLKKNGEANKSQSLLHHINALNNLRTVSVDHWSQLSQLFAIAQKEIESIPNVSKNTILMNAIAGIEEIMEETEEEHKQNQLEADSIKLSKSFANLSVYDLESILDIVEHGEKPVEEKKPELND